MKNKRGQIWIETAMPRISEARDKSIVEQTIQSMNVFDGKISEILDKGAGNTRYVDLLIKRGAFYVNSSANSLIFILTGLGKPYSEVGVNINVGQIDLITEKMQTDYKVILALNYSKQGINITYNGEEKEAKADIAPTPHRFLLENRGSEVIDVREVSQ
jgi:hypothetical protein